MPPRCCQRVPGAACPELEQLLLLPACWAGRGGGVSTAQVLQGRPGPGMSRLKLGFRPAARLPPAPSLAGPPRPALPA